MNYTDIKKVLKDFWNGKELETKQTIKTQIYGGGNEDNQLKRALFSSNEKTYSPHKLYMEGGPFAEAIDSYALYTLSPGYDLQCKEGAEAYKEKVQQWFDKANIDFDSILYQGIVESCLNGTAVQELVYGRGGEVVNIIPRDSSTFRPVYDKYGTIQVWEQQVEQFGKAIQIPPKYILSLTLFPVAGEVKGTSIYQRAYDDVMRDCDVVESSCTAIHRHGHPKMHIQVGSPDEPSSPEELSRIQKETQALHSKNDFVTDHLTQMHGIDLGGVGNIDTYSNFTLQRMACATGVPEEILGLGRGSTEATANVRLRTFYDKIGSIQQRVSRAYNRQLIDLITGVPGIVWIEFKEVAPENMGIKAAWIAQLRAGLDPDAVVPAEWAREQLGIPPDEREDILPDAPEDDIPQPGEDEEEEAQVGI
jgi:hypothetical protein